ncbi:MAG: FixH family protein [Geminicoccaceae bacterium]
MSVFCRLLAIVSIILIPTTVLGQSKVDPFDFLEEWDLISQDFRNGKLELTAEGLPPGFDAEPSKKSEDGHFDVSIRSDIDPIPMNEIHTWLVEIKTADGAPVRDADVRFFGSMPLHGHGFPTQPRISGEVDPGVYALEGIKFSMAGWWSMGVGIEADGKTDRVGFNVIFEP